MRNIIIGDIHGCSTAFQALLSKVKVVGNDRLILLGDLFDRGPDSFEVFRMVRQLAGAMDEDFVLLRGNHEDYLLSPKLTLMQRIVWERVGRGTTVSSFKAHGDRMESAIPWLSENCRMFYQGEGFQCVHAGLLTEPIEANDPQTMIHDHSVVRRNVYTGPLTVTGHIALPAAAWFAGDGKTVTAVPEGERQPLPAAGILCIDTGCGKGGKLTAMVIEDGGFRLVSVPEEGSERA